MGGLKLQRAKLFIVFKRGEFAPNSKTFERPSRWLDKKNNLEKVCKAAVLSFFLGLRARKTRNTRTRKRPGRLLRASKDDDSGREARPLLGVGQQTRTAYS